LSETQQLMPGGSINLRRVCKSTSLAKVKAGLEALGLEQFTPEPRTPLSCLRAVIDDVYKPDDKAQKYKFEPYKNGVNGYKIVTVKPKDTVRPGDKYGEIVAVAGLKEDGELKLDPRDQAKADEIRAGMSSAAQWLSKASVSNALSRIAVEHFNALSPGEVGGVYWINQCHHDRWQQVARVFEEASAEKDEEGKTQPPTRVYILEVVANEQMLRAVTDALTEEVEFALRVIEHQINDLDPTDSATINRAARLIRDAGKVEAKVKNYEQTFGVSHAKLLDQVSRVGQAAAEASLNAVAAQQAPTPLLDGLP